jgi:hypothetical protein
MRRLFAATLWLLSFSVFAFQPRTGHWNNLNESGRGFNIDIQDGVMVLTMYAYDQAGNAQWYLASGPMTNGQRSFTGTLEKYVGGQCVQCDYRPPSVNGNDGTISVAFVNETTANVTLPGGRTTTITPFNFKYDVPPNGLVGEWVYTYDIISTFAERFNFTTKRAATTNGNGTVWDDARNAACELQVSGPASLLGKVVCIDFTSSGTVANNYVYRYGIDETFDGLYLLGTSTNLHAMKGFRISGSQGYERAKVKSDEEEAATMTMKKQQEIAAPRSTVNAVDAAVANVARAMWATK